ncbi:hypothetical protein CUJ84_Chr002241 [Rhizobium leguminosarum]|uniref:Uncharacterized protein n=1 Tax=Rhizobium leguminosarum TaxID=384 RepID=A0A2K9Z2Z3_RHILE|nr:hypothetical protein CUJ84_Chr002241 [Rhizobium leguminosarum]
MPCDKAFDFDTSDSESFVHYRLKFGGMA